MLPMRKEGGAAGGGGGDGYCYYEGGVNNSTKAVSPANINIQPDPGFFPPPEFPPPAYFSQPQPLPSEQQNYCYTLYSFGEDHHYYYYFEPDLQQFIMLTPEESLSPEVHQQPAAAEKYSTPDVQLGDDEDDTANSMEEAAGTTEEGTGDDVQLPLPADALPPRKRAKTTEEKEQRRVQRIMRNRQAAHASREKKRKHVETLEKSCADLTDENKLLKKKCDEMKKNQVQMMEQQYLLATKIKQYQSIIQAAKALGDLTTLDNVPTNTELISPADTTNNSSCSSPVSIKEEYASPESLVLNNSNSNGNEPPTSPLNLEETDDKKHNVISSVSSSLLGNLNNQSQHPAAMLLFKKFINF